MDGSPDSEKRGLFDPVFDALDNMKSGIRPDSLGSMAGGSKENNKKNTDKNAGAADKLSSMEKSAGGGVGNVGKGLDGINKLESSAPGNIINSVKGKLPSSNSKGTGKGKGFFKKGGPILGVISIIILFGAFSFGGLSTQLVSWKENIYSMFGQNSAIMNKRSNYMMDTLLNTERNTTRDSFFGGSKFKISSKLADKLKAQGIEYIETSDADGKKIKMLVFEDADGAAVPVVSRKKDISRVNSLAGTDVEVNGKILKFKDTGMTLSEARSKNADFDAKFHAATITFTGKIAGWFDNVADSMYKRIVGEGARNKTKLDDPSEEEVNKLLLENSSKGADDTDLDVTKEVEDEDGNSSYRPAESHDEVADGKTYGDIASDNGKLSPDSPDVSSTKNKLTARAQKVAMLSSTVACGFLKSIGAISTAIGAIQTANVIQYASKYLEIADKIKAGDADKVTNVALNNLNSSIKTIAYDINGDEVEVDGSVTSSDGWNTVFSSKNLINENDPSALMSNREFATRNALNGVSSGLFSDIASAVAGFGGGVAAFKICNGVQAVAGLVDGVSDIVLAFTTAGIGNFLKEIVKGAIKGAVFSAIMISVTSVISAITPMVATWLAGNLTNVFIGKNGGFALLSGSQNIMNSNLQMSTGRFANKDNVIQVFGLTKDVEKEWASYERSTKSPFDITNKYTFLGSIVNTMIPIINSPSTTIASIMGSVIKLTGSSILAFVNPAASAAEEVNDFSVSLSGDGDCAYLSSVGVVGDFACNKYVGAYVDELTTVDPETIHQNMESYGSFDGEDSFGNPKVNGNSNYAKYIVACVTSDTQPGTMNAAVEGYIQKATTTGNVAADGLINFGSNFVPFSGFIDAVDAAEQEANFKWNSGLACTGDTGDNSIDEQVRNFSMYNLDQRVLNEMGILETNSTVSFLEDYYKENPLDQSFEGKIARFSGMTKDQVSDTLAVMEYYDFVANYNAGERYAFGESVVEVKQELRFNNNNKIANNSIITLMNQIVYPDIRNRNFVV